MGGSDKYKTLVLGSNGRLGRILSGFARREGLPWLYQARSAPADLVWSGDFSNPAFRAHLADGVTTLVNLVGITPSVGLENRMEEVNHHFAAEVLAQAERAGVAHVVLVSTAAVYGDPQDIALNEGSCVLPVTPYGTSKARMEQAAFDWCEQRNGIAVSILRVGNVAGADSLLEVAERRAGKGDMPLHVFGQNGPAIRPYIGPFDFFRVVKAVCERPVTKGEVEVFNVAHPAPVSLDRLLAAYRDTLLHQLTWAEAPAPAGIAPRVAFDVTKLCRIMDFPPVLDPVSDMAAQVAACRAMFGDTKP